jgi:PAS domain S-box-containing protein
VPTRSKFPANDAAATHRGIDTFHVVAKLAPYAMAIADAGGRILVVNLRAEAMFGYAPHELEGQTIEVLVAEGSRAIFSEELNRVASRSPLLTAVEIDDLIGLRKDGTTFAVEISLSPLEAEGGVLVCGVFQDLSGRVQIAEQLRASEERFRTLGEQSSDAIFIADAAGRYQDVNPAGCEMFGYTREEILQRSIVDLLPPTEVARLGEEVARLDVKPVKSEWLFLRKDGSMFFGEVNARRLSDSRLIANVRDVSTRREVERELRASKHFIEAVAMASPPLIYVFDLDETRLTYINRSIVGQLGHAENDAPVYRLAEFQTFMPPEEAPHLARVLSEWRSLSDGHLREDEYRLRDANGVFRWFMGRETVFARHANGTVRQVLGTLFDITDRKLAEARLRESQIHLEQSEARYRLIVENQTESIVKWRPDGTRTFVNESYCRTFGVREEECVGTSFFPLVAPEFREEIRRLTAALTPESPSYTEEHLALVPGGERWQQWTNRGMFDADGRLVEILSSGRDITDRVRLEEQLRQSQKMQAIGQLAGGVAHDFNNLLTVINGHSELLLMDHADTSDPLRAELVAIRDAGERAALLTRQLLLFSRKAVFEPRVLDVNSLLRQTSQMLRRLIGEDVRLTTVLSPSLYRVRVDPSQIEQVIMNLSLNARDAMPRGGRLTIETRNAFFTAEDSRAHPELKSGHFVHLRVTDTGSGMTSDVKEHLFEPFFTTKGPGRGTGLGLATVYGIVHASGGFVTVSSEVDTGTTFNVFLPAHEPDASAVPADAAGRRPVGRGETVLIVEDEEGVRQIVRATMEMHGYTVLVASSGPEALRLIDGRQDTVDLLLTDVVMPGMSGTQLAEAILERRPGCRVVFMSGYNEDALVLDPATQAFIQKPFTPQVLARKVRELLDRV